MSTTIRSAVSGLLAQQSNLDMIANNIANMSTAGYKASRAVFADAAYEVESAIPLPDGEPTIPETREGTGVRLVASQRLFSQGNLRETDNPWDLAIAGDGFFQVSMPDGTSAYTRDGSFQLDAQGRLETADGFLVNPPVQVPQDAQDVRVDQAGIVRGTLKGQPVQFGNIQVVTFPNPDGLLAVGHNLYVPTDASGSGQAGQAGTDQRGQIVSGVLEDSNVDLAEEMTRAMEAQRAYEMGIKMLQTSDDMLSLANNLIK